MKHKWRHWALQPTDNSTNSSALFHPANWADLITRLRDPAHVDVRLPLHARRWRLYRKPKNPELSRRTERVNCNVVVVVVSTSMLCSMAFFFHGSMENDNFNTSASGRSSNMFCTSPRGWPVSRHRASAALNATKTFRWKFFCLLIFHYYGSLNSSSVCKISCNVHIRPLVIVLLKLSPGRVILARSLLSLFIIH